MEQKVDLSKGGIAVVLIGTTGMIKEYANNPSVMFIDTKSVDSKMISSLMPDNLKAIIMTEGCGQLHVAYAQAVCRQKNIPYLFRKSNQAIYETLKGFFPNGDSKPTSEVVKETQSRGRLIPLLEFIDWSKSNAENARALMKKAIELNIRTNEASLAQIVSKARKMQNAGTRPNSARPKLDLSIELLDEMIKNLGDMRDFIIATTEENRELRKRVERFKAALSD